MSPEELNEQLGRRREEWKTHTAKAHLRRALDLLGSDLFMMAEDREVEPTPDGWRQIEPTGRVVIVATRENAAAVFRVLAEQRGERDV